MSAGDTYNGLASVAASGTLTIQPAVGTEIMLTRVFSSNHIGTIPYKLYNINVSQFDGSSTSYLSNYLNRHDQVASKFLAKNTMYLLVTNLAATVEVIGYTGIQIK